MVTSGNIWSQVKGEQEVEFKRTVIIQQDEKTVIVDNGITRRVLVYSTVEKAAEGFTQAISEVNEMFEKSKWLGNRT